MRIAMLAKEMLQHIDLGEHMPIYEFRCLKCKEDFETIVFGSNDKVTCPHCNGDKLERLMSSLVSRDGGGGR